MSANVSEVIRRHVGPEVSVCDTEGLICRDYICGCCASQCVFGLMMQLANANGGVTAEDSGTCGQSFYIPACYPCVVTDGCCVIGAVSQFDDPDVQRAASAAIEYNMRQRLMARAGVANPAATALLQVCCPVLFCTSCHYAAVARELRPPGHGSFWCARDAQYALM